MRDEPFSSVTKVVCREDPQRDPELDGVEGCLEGTAAQRLVVAHPLLPIPAGVSRVLDMESIRVHAGSSKRDQVVVERPKALVVVDDDVRRASALRVRKPARRSRCGVALGRVNDDVSDPRQRTRAAAMDGSERAKARRRDWLMSRGTAPGGVLIRRLQR